MAGDSLETQLADELSERKEAGLLRTLNPLPAVGLVVEVAGRSLLNLAGNDYLALANDPRLIAAAVQATKRFGVGSGASRLVAGHLEIHEQCERDFAKFKGAEKALLFSTGYMANLGVMTALAGPGDTIFQDKLNHASLIDAVRATGGTVRTYPHLHTDKLRRLLDRAGKARRRFIVTDAVFSMDGDCADLPALIDLAERYDATLIVDEAHGTGVLGPTGRGLAEALGVASGRFVTICTASKALGSLGGIVLGSQVVVDTLINHARSLIYTTAPPPAQAAAIGEALSVIQNEPNRVKRIQAISQRVRDGLREMGWPGMDTTPATPIVPLITGDPGSAIGLAERLRYAGILAVAIRPPTVANGSARVRLSLRADLSDEDIDNLLKAIRKVT